MSVICDECGEENKPMGPSDRCLECIEGFWEMMGDDPCGKDWKP